MTSSIPEGGWPEIPVLAPYELPDIPEFQTGVADLTIISLQEEVMSFYQTLVPQLVCVPDGSMDGYPKLSWILSKDGPPKTVVICRAGSTLSGVWIISKNGIHYPCVDTRYVAPIFRALWDESIKHFDYIWASTKNPAIMAFAQKAVRIPRKPSSPTLNGDKLEWRRG